MAKPSDRLVTIRGRGTTSNPANRFVRIEFEPDGEGSEADRGPRTQFFRDASRSVITRNESPDVGFEFSINPYRGCEHGCVYCYARPTHEYFGLSLGLDFESKIFVKEEAPDLLRRELSSERWQPSVIAMSGVTDPYQPVERRLKLTRRCLRVLADFGNPVTVISKNQLIARDADILGEMSASSAAAAAVSITTLDTSLQQAMEPRTSTPSCRLGAISKLAAAGVPVSVMVAPVIPGLTDHEIPEILRAAADAGAASAGYITLRLPYGVKQLFEEWLERHFPERRKKVLNRVRSIRDGKLNDSRFRSRMRGEGEYAEQIRALFRAACEKHGLNRQRQTLSLDAWKSPSASNAGNSALAQLDLF
ncbi:MAG: PA0069 family radical SAM protein [Gemmatimonas sp.]|nr:PA0069 family radical SAM protein [Gemmatimonas sp.]